MEKIEKINNKIDELKKEIIKLETEKNSIKKYQSVAIIRVATSIKRLENIKKEINKIVDIENNKIEELGIKKLAYEVEKQKEGYYIQFYFEGVPEDVTKLERYFRINNNILKFITIRCED